MKYHGNKLFFVAIIACVMSIVVSDTAIASTIQKPEWVSRSEWNKPPLFDVKHSFFVDSSSNKSLGDIKDGLLSCRVMVRDDLKLDVGFIINDSPDLFFKVAIAEGKKEVIMGSGRGYTQWFYVKPRELKIEQSITVHVEDYDGFSANDVVGDIQVKYRGERLFSSTTVKINMRCIVFNASMLKQKAAHQLKGFHQFAKKSTTSMLDNPTESFLFEEYGMQRRILGLAALNGWNSEAVQSASKVYNSIMNIKEKLNRTVNKKSLEKDRLKSLESNKSSNSTGQ